MNLLRAMVRWVRQRRDDTVRLLEHTERLNVTQRQMTEVTGNFLADRYRGLIDEGRR